MFLSGAQDAGNYLFASSYGNFSLEQFFLKFAVGLGTGAAGEVLGEFAEIGFNAFIKKYNGTGINISGAEFADLLPTFIKNPKTIRAWDLLADFPDLRSKVLNLEATAKLDVIKLWSDPGVLKNKLPKIIASLDGAGTDGISILNKIKSGDFDNIDGYKDLIKKLTDPNQVKSVKQAIDKANNFPNIADNLKKFEFEDQVNSIDVDFGILTTPGGPPYLFEKAFQFKFASTVNAVKNRITASALSKINNATANSKIFQIDMGSGSVDDVLNLPNWNSFIINKKNQFPDIEIQIFDGVGGNLIY